jgi:hypothetical protein
MNNMANIIKYMQTFDDFLDCQIDIDLSKEAKQEIYDYITIQLDDEVINIDDISAVEYFNIRDLIYDYQIELQGYPVFVDNFKEFIVFLEMMDIDDVVPLLFDRVDRYGNTIDGIVLLTII